MIRVYVGSHARYAEQEPVLEYSIRANTDADVEVHFMRARDMGLPESGCTGFSRLRYEIPKLTDGYAIYLDVDMLVLGDIAELYNYRVRGHWARLVDGSTEVMVIDTRAKLPHYVSNIPLTWNVEDHERHIPPSMNLLHFTDLKCQPWFYDCPYTEAVEILEEWTTRATTAN